MNHLWIGWENPANSLAVIAHTRTQHCRSLSTSKKTYFNRGLPNAVRTATATASLMAMSPWEVLHPQQNDHTQEVLVGLTFLFYLALDNVNRNLKRTWGGGASWGLYSQTWSSNRTKMSSRPNWAIDTGERGLGKGIKSLGAVRKPPRAKTRPQHTICNITTATSKYHIHSKGGSKAAATIICYGGIAVAEHRSAISEILPAHYWRLQPLLCKLR